LKVAFAALPPTNHPVGDLEGSSTPKTSL